MINKYQCKIENAPIIEEIHCNILKIIERLPPNSKKTFYMAIIEGIPEEEIALKEMQSPPNT